MVIDQSWPAESRATDLIQAKQDHYIRDILKNTRNALDKARGKGKKETVELNRLVIYIAEGWPAM